MKSLEKIFDVKTKWLDTYALGGSIQGNCGGPGQPPCPEETISKEDEKAILDYIQLMNMQTKLTEIDLKKRLEKNQSQDNIPQKKITSKKFVTPEQQKENAIKRFANSKKSELKEYVPQSTLSKTKEIALNPMTAMSYIAQNKDIPDNFSRGPRNTLDYAVDFINPAQYVEDSKNVIQGAVNLDAMQFGEGLLGTLPLALEAKNINKLINNAGNKFLPNAYKLNPLAKKVESFNNPNSFYRQIDNVTYDEGVKSGLIKGKQDIGYRGPANGAFNLNKSFGDDAYYNKGSLYSPQRADYIYEVKKGEEAFIPKVNNRTRGYTTENTPVRVSREPILLTEANIYQKDWLKGYKQVEKTNKKELGGKVSWLDKYK